MSENKDVWAAVTPVTAKPEVVAQTEVDEGVPFGSKTKLMNIISEVRTKFNQKPPERNGIATAPDGTKYLYYMNEDLFPFVEKILEGSNAFLDIGMSCVDGSNVMELTLSDIENGTLKTVSAATGNPNSTADFGTRVTYVPKYLLALMFGISIKTDSDAFDNSENKYEKQTNGNVANV